VNITFNQPAQSMAVDIPDTLLDAVADRMVDRIVSRLQGGAQPSLPPPADPDQPPGDPEPEPSPPVEEPPAPPEPAPLQADAQRFYDIMWNQDIGTALRTYARACDEVDSGRQSARYADAAAEGFGAIRAFTWDKWVHNDAVGLSVRRRLWTTLTSTGQLDGSQYPRP
jgi:hypothetical protein